MELPGHRAEDELHLTKATTGLVLALSLGAVTLKSHRGCDLQQPTAL